MKELEDSLRYLSSDRALASVDADVYWPKWDSPWWHLSLLYELGEIKRAPAPVIHEMVRALAASPTAIHCISTPNMREEANLASPLSLAWPPFCMPWVPG